MRLDDWEKRLNDHLENVGAFKWGTNDCCMFAVKCVNVMTGVDHGKKFRGYKTGLGAMKHLNEYGGVEGIATACLGEAKQPKLAKRGDVVSLENDDAIALGICVGDKIAAIGKDGVVFVPMKNALKAWSI